MAEFEIRLRQILLNLIMNAVEAMSGEDLHQRIVTVTSRCSNKDEVETISSTGR